MLNLFKNIFSQSNSARTQLPATLVKMAIERAVDGTDPRVRIMSGYAKTLREPVTHAIKHVISLVDSFPAPVGVGKTALGESPVLAALLYSEERMNHFLSRDAALREFMAASSPIVGPVTALLMASRTEKRGFGTAMVGERMQSDVPLTTVSFEQHRLLEPAVEEQETRRRLKRRAFDHLLAIALAQITQRKDERDTLASRKALLRSKLDTLRRGGGFGQQTGAAELKQLQARLDEIDGQLSALGAPEDTLSDNIAIVADVLAASERHLWQVDTILCLDRLYVLHDRPGKGAPPTVFRELHNSEGLQATIMMISIGS